MIIGTGIDIVEISRIKRAIERWGEHFLNHVFCPEEIEYAHRHKFPEQHLAVRFAAKEAVYKAIQENVPPRWKDLKILNDQNGRPFCVYNDANFKNKILISLSHTENYAVASAIVTT
ncbi:MAG: holo-ACP synthase [Candidatus Omnitrophica bacterium]|nr:holo-ACP synthase [Candidatus Omnitrophota bacterium]